jgi:hypothetical protein
MTDNTCLCFRCEHRARGFERNPKSYPRYECGDLTSAVSGCYMYKPAAVVVLKKRSGEKRPVFAGSMISARMRAVRLAKSTVKGMSFRHSHRAREYVLYHDLSPDLPQHTW